MGETHDTAVDMMPARRPPACDHPNAQDGLRRTGFARARDEAGGHEVKSWQDKARQSQAILLRQDIGSGLNMAPSSDAHSVRGPFACLQPIGQGLGWPGDEAPTSRLQYYDAPSVFQHVKSAYFFYLESNLFY